MLGRWELQVGFLGCLPEHQSRYHTKRDALDYVRYNYDDPDYRGMITDLVRYGRWDHAHKTEYATLTKY